MAIAIPNSEQCSRADTVFGESTAFSVCFWMMRTATSSSFAHCWHYRDTTPTEWVRVTLNVSDYTFRVEDETTGYNSTAVATIDTWYFVALSQPAAGDSTLYVWGLSDSAPTTATGGTRPLGTCQNIRMGDSTTNYGLVGRVGFLKMWNGAALTQAQFEKERWSGRPANFSSLYLFCPFFTNGYDYSGNGRSFETTTVTFADGPPVGWGSRPLVSSAISATAGSIVPTITL